MTQLTPGWKEGPCIYEQWSPIFLASICGILHHHLHCLHHQCQHHIIWRGSFFMEIPPPSTSSSPPPSQGIGSQSKEMAGWQIQSRVNAKWVQRKWLQRFTIIIITIFHAIFNHKLKQTRLGKIFKSLPIELRPFSIFFLSCLGATQVFLICFCHSCFEGL